MKGEFIMKRRILSLLNFVIIFMLMVPMVSFAADKKMDDMLVSATLNLKSGKPGTEVKKLSTGPVNRNINTFEEYLSATPIITLSATEDSNNGKFYWSDKVYKNKKEKTESIAVLKENGIVKTDVVIKVEDIANITNGIAIDMGAASDGPAKYKISYSTDCGKTWKKLNSFGSDRGKISKANTVITVFSKNLADIKRTYKTKNIKEKIENEKTGILQDYEWKMKLYNDIYFKISASSDDRVDGQNKTAGNLGEWGIRSVTLLEEVVFTDTLPHKPNFLKAYKTSKKEITLNWKKVNEASGYDIYLQKEGKKYKKVKSIKGASTTSYKINNLLPAGNYKVKICSYKERGGQKVCSSFTKPVFINMKSQPLPKDIILKGVKKIKIGDRKRLVVKCINGASDVFINKIEYKVKNRKVAKISNTGIVEAKRCGNTEIVVTVKLKSGLTKKFVRIVKIIK